MVVIKQPLNTTKSYWINDNMLDTPGEFAFPKQNNISKQISYCSLDHTKYSLIN